LPGCYHCRPRLYFHYQQPADSNTIINLLYLSNNIEHLNHSSGDGQMVTSNI